MGWQLVKDKKIDVVTFIRKVRDFIERGEGELDESSKKMGSKKGFCTFRHSGNSEIGIDKSDSLVENVLLDIH